VTAHHYREPRDLTPPPTCVMAAASRAPMPRQNAGKRAALWTARARALL